MADPVGLPVASFLIPINGGNFAVVKDVNLERGFKAVADIAGRDALTPEVSPEGTWCWVTGTLQLFYRASDLQWVLVDIGGGGGGGDLPDPTSQDGKALFSDGSSVPVWRFITPDDIKSFVINSFALSGASVVEVGASVATPGFTATYSDTVADADLTDSEGTPSKDVTATPNSFSSDGTFQKTANNDSVTFTLTAEDASANQDVANTTLRWQPRVYYGEDDFTKTKDEAFIEALPNNALQPNRNTTMNLNVGAAEKAYWAAPLSYGTPTFQVGQFPGGFIQLPNVSVTNAEGVTQDYQLWESLNSGLGQVTITVS